MNYIDELIAKMPKAATVGGHECFDLDEAFEKACSEVDRLRSLRASDVRLFSGQSDTAKELCSEIDRLRLDLAAANKRCDADPESDSVVASCNCLTKTNEVAYHKPGCKYRLICERDAAKARCVELEGELEKVRAVKVEEICGIPTTVNEVRIEKARQALASENARLREARGIAMAPRSRWETG